MSRFRKSITRAIYNEFGRFPNVELSQRRALGQVGTYDGRRSEFNWLHTLEQLDITSKELDPKEFGSFVEEQFTMGSETQVSFIADAAGRSSARMNFAQARSLVAQATKMTCYSLDTNQLRAAIIDAIDRGIYWSYDWVVVTDLFVAESYSQFYSSSKKSNVTVSAQILECPAIFNLADPQLQLGVSHKTGAVHQVIAQQNVTPFFLIQKLKGWKREYKIKPYWSPNELTLAPYG